MCCFMIMSCKTLLKSGVCEVRISVCHFSRRSTAMRMLLFLFLLMSQHSMVTTISGCHSDRDKDHRPRVSCVSQGLAAVPYGIDPDTQVLVLSQNAFVSLSWAAYTNFPHLHELDLSQNLISTIDRSGPVLKNLQVLRLSNNTLTSLGRSTFNFTPSLMEIYLDGNTISSLDNATFSDLPLLELINLSRNRLHILPTHLLEHTSSSTLKNFNLEENLVQQLPDNFFASQTDIPYVFLSKNVWVCTCQVGYLQQFLENQGHNIYIQTGSFSVENDPESVVCSAPLTLQGRAIVDLKEEEYCGSDNESQHIISHTPQLMSAPTTALTTTIIPPITRKTTTPSTAESSTTPSLKTTTNKPTTITPTTTEPTSRSTLSTSLQTTTPTSSTPHTIEKTAPTTTPKTAESSTTPITTNKPTTLKAVTMVTQPAGGVLSAHGGGQRSVVWCWWLFITVLMLCIFSAIFSCMLLLWLVIIYITLYQPIKQQVHSSEGVTLRVYQVTADRSLTVDTPEAERVMFLPPDMIQETRPVFRSVLFISTAGERREGMSNEEEEKKRRTDTGTKIDLLPAATLHREEETESNAREEVFRKTLHRVISQEEEIDDWKEVEEKHWAMTEKDKGRKEGGVERQKTRYSLILKEERGNVMEGRKGEMEWVVGEWEMRGGQGSWGSLVRMKEGCGLSDTIHVDPHKPVEETSV